MICKASAEAWLSASSGVDLVAERALDGREHQRADPREAGQLRPFLAGGDGLLELQPAIRPAGAGRLRQLTCLATERRLGKFEYSLKFSACASGATVYLMNSTAGSFALRHSCSAPSHARWRRRSPPCCGCEARSPTCRPPSTSPDWRAWRRRPASRRCRTRRRRRTGSSSRSTDRKTVSGGTTFHFWMRSR